MGLLTALSLIPENLHVVIDIIPPEWKPYILAVAAISAFILRIIAGVVAKDRNVTHAPFPVLPTTTPPE